MSLDGGRSLTWERSFHSESEVKPNRGFWNKVVDVIAGAPDFDSWCAPTASSADSRGRIIVTDPGAAGVHIFDFAQRKYKFIERHGKARTRCARRSAWRSMPRTTSTSPIRNRARSSSSSPAESIVRTIGSLKGGEGYFKRPTGIAVDSAAQRIYVTDTLRDQMFILDMQGNVLQTIGKSGDGEGEFNFPTELRLDGHEPAGGGCDEFPRAGV